GAVNDLLRECLDLRVLARGRDLEVTVHVRRCSLAQGLLVPYLGIGDEGEAGESVGRLPARGGVHLIANRVVETRVLHLPGTSGKEESGLGEIVDAELYRAAFCVLIEHRLVALWEEPGRF